MIRLTQHASFDQPRRIPIQLLGTFWLNSHMLLGLALLAGSVVYIASLVKSGRLPTDLALMLDHAKAPATIDAVQTRTKTKGKNMKVIEYLHQFHFQLPGGMQHSGTSISSSKNQGKVATVVYYPANPQINRLQGMSAEQDSSFRFSAILAVVSAIMIVFGIRQARATYRLLRFATLSQAMIVACRRNDNNAKWTFEVGELSVTLPERKSSAGDEIPVVQYQSMVLEQTRSLYDSKGHYVGTAWQRSLSVAIAAFFGALFGVILGVITTLIVLQKPGFQLLHGMGTGAAIGAIALAIAEKRWRFFIRGIAPKPDAKPAAFVKCTCVLEIAPSSDLPTQVRLTKKLDLAGDASDLLPRPILYRKDRANGSLLLSELGLTGSPDTTSGDFILTGTPHRPVLIALSVIIIATIVGVMLAG